MQNLVSDAVMVIFGAVSGPTQIDIKYFQNTGGAWGQHGNAITDVNGLVHVVGDKDVIGPVRTRSVVELTSNGDCATLFDFTFDMITGIRCP